MSNEVCQDDEAVLIGLGANLPFRALSGPDLLAAALARLAQEGLRILATSRPWTSPSWPPGLGAPDYVNAVARIDAGSLGPEEVLDALMAVEAAFGRTRSTPNAPRTLDLDLLAFGRALRETGRLVLPHPRLGGRDFVLGPLLEVAPGWRCPRTGLAAQALWEALPGRSAQPLALRSASLTPLS